MILFPNAKVNIGLYVVAKRTDGFHDLETVFYPVNLCDVLELNKSEGERGSCSFKTTGIAIDCDPGKNLVMKAHALLAHDFDLPALQVHLHKVIPFGAGLGGGSSDAAFMLKGINEFCELGLSDKDLEIYATRLGSDCAFFIQDKPVYATGRGEIMESLSLSLSSYEFVLVKPNRGVSTPEAYAGIHPRPASFDLHRLPKLPVEQWQGMVHNDFERTVARKIPEILAIKQQLKHLGACYVSMTGSGSAVYALFDQQVDVKSFFPDFYVWQSWD